MTSDQIETFFLNAKLKERKVRIDFKTRAPITGLFIETKDYEELKAKNFWRIINESKIGDFLVDKDVSVARIFNGSEITKLSILKSKS